MFWVSDKKSHKIASWEKKLWPFLLSPFKSRFFSFFHLSEKLTEKNDNIKNKKKLCISLWLVYKFSHHSIFWFLSYSPWRKIHKKSDKSVNYTNIFMKSRVMNLCFTTHPHVFFYRQNIRGWAEKSTFSTIIELFPLDSIHIKFKWPSRLQMERVSTPQIIE